MPPQNIPIRPLLGIVRNTAPQRIPLTNMYDVKGFIVEEKGMRRRPTWEEMAGGGTVDYPPIRRVGSFWDDSGTSFSFVVGKKHLYSVSSTALTKRTYVYSTGTITATASDATVTGSSTLWDTAASDIKAGDVIVLDADGSGNGPEEHLIDSITSDTELEMNAVATASHGAGTDYEIRRAFRANLPAIVDWTQVPDQAIILTDTQRLWTYDGTTLAVNASVDESASAVSYVGRCATYWGDRLWVGRTTEGSATYRDRIRWTDAGSTTVFRSTSVLDLPYQEGELMRMLPLGDVLTLYFEDGIWVSRETNIPLLPYSFVRMDTNGVGLVGMRAVVPFINGHFFCGQDNFYFFNNSGLRPIGDKVAKDFIQQFDVKWLMFGARDIRNDRIVWGVPNGEGVNASLDTLLSFNYKTQEWSRETIDATMVEDFGFRTALAWGDMSGAWSAQVGSWGSLRAALSAPRLVHGRTSGVLAQLREGGTLDFDADNVSVLLESGDIDLNLPNTDKQFLRMSVKLNDHTATALPFTVQGSTDRGNSWKALGTLTIAADTDEGFLNFRQRGSTFRYRLTSVAAIAPYTISEIVLRARGDALEVRET